MPVTVNAFFLVIVASLVAGWVLETWARAANLRAMAPELPPEFAEVMDADRYRASQNRTRDQARLAQVTDTLQLGLILVLMVSGGFGHLAGWADGLGWHPIIEGLVFLGVLGLGYDLVATPFTLYETFVLEERYGLNTTTPATFAADKLKGWALAGIIGGIMAGGVLAFFTHAGSLAWVWAWIALTLFALAMQYVAPAWIMPLFNRFDPLEDEDYRRPLEKLASEQGYDLSGIFVMDGSRRSRRSNAFLAGFGKKKRIALFDTLLEKNSPQEVRAVLAHELGHYKLGHVPALLAMFAVRTGISLAVLAVFLRAPGLYAAFGMDHAFLAAGLFFFGLLYMPASLVLQIATNAVSRSFERAADDFAARTTGPGHLYRALRKLAADNLANLTPHPAKVVLHYAHPPVLARIRRLEARMDEEPGPGEA